MRRRGPPLLLLLLLAGAALLATASAETNYCTSTTCANGATCDAQYNGVCLCAPGWGGVLCNIIAQCDLQVSWKGLAAGAAGVADLMFWQSPMRTRTRASGALRQRAGKRQTKGGGAHTARARAEDYDAADRPRWQTGGREWERGACRRWLAAERKG